jgi:hypothetical protein
MPTLPPKLDTQHKKDSAESNIILMQVSKQLYRPSDRNLPTKLVPTLADRVCRVGIVRSRTKTTEFSFFSLGFKTKNKIIRF